MSISPERLMQPFCFSSLLVHILGYRTPLAAGLIPPKAAFGSLPQRGGGLRINPRSRPLCANDCREAGPPTSLLGRGGHPILTPHRRGGPFTEAGDFGSGRDGCMLGLGG